MISSIQIKGFKSYRDASLSLAPLTLLIGANASGKSNAIEAIRFLSWLASGRRLDDIMGDVQGGDQLIRGTVATLAAPGKGTFGLGLRTEERTWNRFSIRISVSDDGLRIVDERIDDPQEAVPLYSVDAPADVYGHDIKVQYNNFARGGVKPKIACTDQQAVFTQLATPARFGKGHTRAQKEIPATVEQLRRDLERILFLDPSPRRMRQYSFKSERRLKGDGANLSSVLFDLCRGQDRKAEILEFIRDLPEQEIRDIDFIETARAEVMVQLEESFGGSARTWDAPNLSDGTLRVLAVAAALLSSEQGSLVIIEELDNGVHPSRADALLRNISRVAEQRRLRVLLTTHNPALLDAVPDEAIPDVVHCFRDPETGASQLARLEELPDYARLLALGPLGRSMAAGRIEDYLKDRQTEKDRRNQALEWLRGLERQVTAS
ncbi:MAG: AAA family ATPase [Acidobacteriota bacterium]